MLVVVAHVEAVVVLAVAVGRISQGSNHIPLHDSPLERGREEPVLLDEYSRRQRLEC